MTHKLAIPHPATSHSPRRGSSPPSSIPSVQLPRMGLRSRQQIREEQLFRKQMGKRNGHRVMSSEELNIYFHYVLAAHTLAEAVERIKHFHDMLRERYLKGYIRIDEVDDRVVVNMKFAWEYNGDRALQTSDIIKVINWFNFLRWATAEDLDGTRVEIPFKPTRQQTVFLSRFCNEVRINKECFKIIFPARHLSLALVKSTSDIREFHSLVDLYFISGFASAGSTAQHVGRIVGAALTSGQCAPSLDDVASRLNQSSSTLKRKLGAEGRSYQSIVNEQKLTLSYQLLSNTDHSIEAVAHRLGYQDHNAFRRAFKRWAGIPPAAWRRLNQ